jgi:putative transposase
VAERGRPAVIVSDNGPEFAGRTLNQWAYQQGVRLHFIDRGKPIQNAYVESFQGKLRDECLNGHWFLNLADARQTLAEWQTTDNRVRPHNALGYITREEFARAELKTNPRILGEAVIGRRAMSISSVPVRPCSESDRPAAKRGLFR